MQTSAKPRATPAELKARGRLATQLNNRTEYLQGGEASHLRAKPCIERSRPAKVQAWDILTTGTV